MLNQTLTLGVIITNRNFFADTLVASGRKEILQALAELGINCARAKQQPANARYVKKQDHQQAGVEWIERRAHRQGRDIPLNRAPG